MEGSSYSGTEPEETHHASDGVLNGIRHSLSDVISKYLIPGTEGYVVSFRDYRSAFTEEQIMELQNLLASYLNDETKSRFSLISSADGKNKLRNGSGGAGDTGESVCSITKTELLKSSAMFYFQPIPRELDIRKLLEFQNRLDNHLPGFQFVPGGKFSGTSSSIVGFTKPGDSNGDSFLAMCSGDMYLPYFKYTAKRPTFTVDIILWLVVLGLLVFAILVYCNFEQEYSNQGYTLEDAWKEVNHFVFK